MRLFRPYLTLLRKQRRLMLVTTVLSILQSLLLLPVALLVKRVFDEGVPQQSTSIVISSAALILVLYVLSATAGLVNRYLVLRTVKQVIADLREQLVRRMHSLSASQVDRTEASDLHALVVQDSERLDQAAGQALAVLVPAAIVTLALAGVAAVLDPLLAAVLLVAVPTLTVIARLLGRSVRAFIKRWHDDFDQFSGGVTDAVRRLGLTRVLATTERDIATSVDNVRTLQISGTGMAWRIGSWNILNGLVAAGSGVAVLVVGSLEVIHNRLTLGELLSFYALSALMLRSFGSLLGSIPVLSTGAPSLVRVQELLETPLDLPYTGTSQLDFRGEVELRGVHFGYDDHELLHGIDLRLGAGEKVALVGPNGAGKSTIARLVLGLYRPQQGELLADGVPYDELDLGCLHARTGVLFQDQVLHRGSIADVIRAGREATDDQVRTAAQQAGADGFVEALPDGYNSVAGDASKLLSGGQRQRLGLARALLTQPTLLLLDEPTTHLDDAGVAQLLELLDALPQRPTVIMVTHDLALARRADRVIEVRDGKVTIGMPV